MDALEQLKPVKPGTYYLIPLLPDLAKMDALTQRINIIPDSYKDVDSSCKQGLVGQTQPTQIRADSKEVQYDYQNSS
jgi:hypothetical protein